MTAIKTQQFDLIIVGGGMAGASMALALSHLDLSIAVIEAHPYQQASSQTNSQTNSQPSFDDRCLALAWSSRQIYQSMGIWKELEAHNGCEAIKQIHISDRGHFGVTRLHHQEENVAALGYVVESRVVGELLLAKMQAANNIDIFSPADIQQLYTSTEDVQVELLCEKKKHCLSAQLLIVADGVQSQTRTALGIQINQQSYGQTAIIANIETQQAHNNIAYERFTDSGPLAILPLTRGRCSLVWTVRDAQLQSIMNMTDKEFIQALQQRFGQRLGKLNKVGQRSAYPLVSMTINNETLAHQHRVALIGNAAHGVHPVAGQGFNLGLRDIATLAEIISSGTYNDLGDTELLQCYWSRRQSDIQQVTRITDNLIKLFSNQSHTLAVLRNTGLLMTDIIAPMKHAIAHEAMGLGFLQGKITKMASGQTLFDK